MGEGALGAEWVMTGVSRSADRQPDAVPSGEIDRTFWIRHMRTGFGVFLGESLVVMLYLRTTSHGPHRFALEIVVAIWFLLATTGLLAAPPLASTQSRAAFSASWTIASILAVGVVATLDGGVDSPTLLLLFLPVGFAALAFTPVVTTACGVFTLATMAVVAVTDADVHIFHEDAFVMVGVLFGATVLSVAASINRTRPGRPRTSAVSTGDNFGVYRWPDGMRGSPGIS